MTDIGFSDKELQAILAGKSNAPKTRPAQQASSVRSKSFQARPLGKPKVKRQPSPATTTAAPATQESSLKKPLRTKSPSSPRSEPSSTKELHLQPPPDTSHVPNVDTPLPAPVEADLQEQPTAKLLNAWQEVERRKTQIEAENKRRQKLLATTLASRRTQVFSEVKRLKQLQEELAQLEKDLSFDINLLRGRIETSAKTYEAARQRFDRAEAEYVQAKLEMHKASDVKEQLTEHLMLIIQKNEERKAEKLDAIMTQLDADVSAVASPPAIPAPTSPPTAGGNQQQANDAVANAETPASAAPTANGAADGTDET
eukprot:m.291443 g.291443  ORF g.291443 m.291443 type:complete len:313 (+) comp17816_c0_seq6:6785-7723(+)